MGVVFQSRVCGVRNAFCMMKNVSFLIYNNNDDTCNCNNNSVSLMSKQHAHYQFNAAVKRW